MKIGVTDEVMDCLWGSLSMIHKADLLHEVFGNRLSKDQISVGKTTWKIALEVYPKECKMIRTHTDIVVYKSTSKTL